MIRLRGSVTIEPFDPGVLQDAVGLALARWREVGFAAGRVVDPATGPREGLQVANGHHPREGVVYRLFTEPLPPVTPAEQVPGAADADPEPVPPTSADWQVTTLGLVADRPSRLELEIRQHGPPPVLSSVELSPRDRPDRVVARVDVDVPGPWPVRGRVRAEGEAQLDGVRVSAGHIANAHGTVRHPRGRGDGTVVVTALTADRWEVTVTATARGRGVLRPVAAIGLRFFRRNAQRQLDEAIAKVPDQLAELRAQLVAPDGTPRTADDLAAELITETISSVPESVPAEVQRRR